MIPNHQKKERKERKERNVKGIVCSILFGLGLLGLMLVCLGAGAVLAVRHLAQEQQIDPRDLVQQETAPPAPQPTAPQPAPPQEPAPQGTPTLDTAAFAALGQRFAQAILEEDYATWRELHDPYIQPLDVTDEESLTRYLQSFRDKLVQQIGTLEAVQKVEVITTNDGWRHILVTWQTDRGTAIVRWGEGNVSGISPSFVVEQRPTEE